MERLTPNKLSLFQKKCMSPHGNATRGDKHKFINFDGNTARRTECNRIGHTKNHLARSTQSEGIFAERPDFRCDTEAGSATSNIDIR